MKNEHIIQVRQYIEPILDSNGFELVDVEWLKEGKDQVLRVFIDKEAGVFIEDCQKASELLSPLFDEMEFFNQHYRLEVSSPGLDRPLKTQRDFEKNIGKEIEVRLYQPYMNMKSFMGVLEGLQDQTLSITDPKGKMHALAMKDIAVVKKVVKF